MFLVQPIMIITIYSEQLIIQIICPLGQFITEFQILFGLNVLNSHAGRHPTPA